MTDRWSKWVLVADWLDKGWNIDPEVPFKKGVYRFRVRRGHPERSMEVVYIGRAGSHKSGKNSSGVCSRIGGFITAAMGFWTHSGGEKFYKTAQDDANHVVGHNLSVRDLEVSWAFDDDPECREAEELSKYEREKPAFNTRDPRTCMREDCLRHRKLMAEQSNEPDPRGNPSI